MQKILFISMDALFPTLFWGNVITLFFLLLYYGKGKVAVERNLAVCLMAARFCHAFYYFVASGRGILPDLLSVSIGNSVMLLGFYMEAEAIFRVIKEESKKRSRQLQVILLVSVALFNLLEWAVPSGGIRITVASLGNVAIMLPPVVRMFRSPHSGAFAKSVAILNGVFLFLLLFRAVYGLYNLEAGILDSTALHSLTFLALMLQLIIALPAYTLITKEYADEALIRMATIDKLTGATNRYSFLDTAARLYRQSVMFKAPLSILYLDIDFFKLVNDRYGHAFGDIVLVRLSKIIDGCLRASDLSCRYGGEEFVILLPRADKTAAWQVSNRIMCEVRAARFHEEPDFSFAVSIGVYSGVPVAGLSLEKVIKFADDALYRAKQTGRDRVVLSALCDGEGAGREAN